MQIQLWQVWLGVFGLDESLQSCLNRWPGKQFAENVDLVLKLFAGNGFDKLLCGCRRAAVELGDLRGGGSGGSQSLPLRDDLAYKSDLLCFRGVEAAAGE